MNPLLEVSLEYQENCPKCGENWRVLEEKMHYPVHSSDRNYAIERLSKCDVCEARFKKELRWL